MYWLIELELYSLERSPKLTAKSDVAVSFSTLPIGLSFEPIVPLSGPYLNVESCSALPLIGGDLGEDGEMSPSIGTVSEISRARAKACTCL